MRATELAQHLAKRAKELCEQLLPSGTMRGDEYVAGSAEDEVGKSLNVSISGEKAGQWHDFATGEKGDLIGLIQVTKKIGLTEACLFAQKFLGIEENKFAVSSERKIFKKPNLSSYSLNSEAENYLIGRKIPLEIIKKYKVVAKTDIIIFPYYSMGGEVVYDKGLKIARQNGRKQFYSTKDCKPILFGWQAINKLSRSISICEGEIDALSLAAYGYNAVSIPTGAAGTKWIEYEYDNLAAYDEIFIVYDNDDAGKAAIKEVVERLGAHRCRIVTLPEKDANECLQKNISREEIADCYFNSGYFKPKELRLAKEFIDATIAHMKNVEAGLDGLALPFPSLAGKVALRDDELTIWSGINGHGKSQLIGQVCLHLIAQDVKICIASLEIKPHRLLTRLVRQATLKTLPCDDHIKRVFNDFFAEKLWIFELVDMVDIHRLLNVFEYARKRFFVSHFVIDSLMKLDVGSEDYSAQAKLIQLLGAFKNKFNCHIHLIVHPRKPLNEKIIPNKLDVKGASEITNVADNSFVLFRSKDKEEEMRILEEAGMPTPSEISQKEDALLICNKQRNDGTETRTKLWFNKASGCFRDNYASEQTLYVGGKDLDDEELDKFIIAQS